MEHVCVPPSKIRHQEKSVEQKSEYSICAYIIGNIPVPRFVSCSIFRTLSTVMVMRYGTPRTHNPVHTMLCQNQYNPQSPKRTAGDTNVSMQVARL